MVETRLWLIRHAEPEPGSRDRCYGKLDVALSEEGRLQALRLPALFRGESFAAVYSSPRRRSVETAQALTGDVVIVDDLREIDFGEFEGRPYDEIARDYPDLYRQWMVSPTCVQFPAGESFATMRRRVSRCVDELVKRHVGQSFAVVAHGGTIRIVIAEALQLEDRHIFRIAQSYAGVSLVRCVDGYRIVEHLNVNV